MCCNSIHCAGHHPLQQEIGVICGALHVHGIWYGEKGNFPLFVSPGCIPLGDQAVLGPLGTVCSISMVVSRRFFRWSASQYWGELSCTSGSNETMSSPRSTLRQRKRQFSLLTPLRSLLAYLGGRAYSALPCAGAPPPQRPLSYNMPRRPGVDIRNRCPVERISPNPVPPVLCIPRRCRPCACLCTFQRTYWQGQA